MKNSTTANRVLLDERAMASRLGVSHYTLQKDRQHQRRIPFCRIGTAVRYDPELVFAAIDATAQGGNASQRKAG